MNNVLLIGRLTRDAELLEINNGERSALKFTLAVERTYKKDGESKADFIPVVYFTDAAFKLIDYLTKGRLISVSGRITVRSVEREGEGKKYYTNIEANSINFLDSKKSKAI